jgi:hypothetical protein
VQEKNYDYPVIFNYDFDFAHALTFLCAAVLLAALTIFDVLASLQDYCSSKTEDFPVLKQACLMAAVSKVYEHSHCLHCFICRRASALLNQSENKSVALMSAELCHFEKQKKIQEPLGVLLWDKNISIPLFAWVISACTCDRPLIFGTPIELRVLVKHAKS